MIDILQAETNEQIDEARTLFREYEKWLGLDLCFQGFEQELADLPGKYAPPCGRLSLAYFETRLAGCIALRPLDTDICEMKRLFVRDSYRGKGVGNQLIEALIFEARKIGYRTMRLDTFPLKMEKAVILYEGYGFREISPYYDNPYDGILFMELTL